MQKKLFVLAIAGLSSAAAFAQSNVTIYGIADMGYAYLFDARSLDAKGNVQPGYRTPNSVSSINSGQASSSRLGFKGSEDIGNGMKAFFVLEQGFFVDTGAPQTAGLAFNRQAFMGLSGGFGSISAGRQYTPYYSFVLSMDPFGNGTVGAYKNAWVFPTTVDGNGLTNPVRVDNSLLYTSPSFGGFSATGFFSNNVNGQEDNGSNARNTSMYSLFGQYQNTALNVGANYHYIASGSSGTAASVEKIQNFTLGASYDFNVVKLSAVYSWNEIDYTLSTKKNAELNNFLIGATVPFGKWSAKASYVYSDGKQYGDSQQFAVGLNYDLSKRTDIYTAYSYINNDGTRLSAVNDASNNGTYAAATGYPTAGVFQQGFQVGVRHRF